MEIQEVEVVPPKGRPFILGVIGSLVGALIGAAIWWVIAIATEYEIGFIAWALGGLAGFGMALGYRKGSAAAGAVAAIIAIIGILAARLMIVAYFNQEDILAIQQRMAMLDLPAERLDRVFRLAYHDAGRQTRSEGRCYFDELFWDRTYAAAAKYAALSDDELAARIAEYREWDRSGRFTEPDYVRHALPYHLLGDTLIEVWQSGEPLPEEKWTPAFAGARKQAAALDEAEQLRECRHRSYAMTVAHMNGNFRGAELGLAPGDNDAAVKLIKEAYAEALAMDDAALAAAYAEANDLEWEEGPWDSPEHRRTRLTYHLAERSWREREGVASDVEPIPGDVWDECRREAADTVKALSDEELAERVQAAEQEADDESFAMRQSMKSEARVAIVGGTAVMLVSTFGLIDLLFLGLAVVTAYQVGKSGIEK